MIFRRLQLHTYSVSNGLAESSYDAFTHEQAASMFAAENPAAMRCAITDTVHVWRMDEPIERMKGVSV